MWTRVKDPSGWMDEVPPLPPPAEPPSASDPSSEKDATCCSIFCMAVREGSNVEEDTQEDFPTEEVIEGMNRELDLMNSFPCVSGSSAS